MVAAIIGKSRGARILMVNRRYMVSLQYWDRSDLGNVSTHQSNSHIFKWRLKEGNARGEIPCIIEGILVPHLTPPVWENVLQFVSFKSLPGKTDR